MDTETHTFTSEDHDPSGRGCALAGRVARGDQEPTNSACDACLATPVADGGLGRPDLIWKSTPAAPAVFGQTRSPFRSAAYQYVRASDRLPTVDETPSWPVARVKLFDPTGAGTWYIAGVDPSGLAFGVADLGHGPELGYIDLPELVALRGRFGLPIERDLHWTPTSTRELMGR